METKIDKQLSAPYISPVTFMSSVELLKPMPPKIDKSVFGSQAGGIQARIIATFHFLKLIDDQGVPQQLLRDLAGTPKDSRAPLIGTMLQGAYPFLSDPAFDLSATSTHGLEERFKDLNVSGSTLRKAMAFFASLAKDAGLTVSPHVKATNAGASTSSGGGGKRRGKRGNGGGGGEVPPPKTPDAPVVSTEQDFWLKALERLPVFDPSMETASAERYVKVLETIVTAKATLEGVKKTGTPRGTKKVSDGQPPSKGTEAKEDQE